MAFKMTSPLHVEGTGKSSGSSIKGTSADTRTYNPFSRKPKVKKEITKTTPKKDIKKTPPKETTTAKRTTYNNKNLGGQDQLIKKDKKKQEFVPSPKKATPPPKDKVKVTPKDKIKAGRALKKEGRKEKRSERKDARLERRIARATKKGKAALASGKVGKGSKSLEMRRKVDRLKAKKTSKGSTAKTKPKTKIDFSALGTSLKGEAKKEDKPKKEDTNKSNKGGSAMMMKKGPEPKPKAKMRTDAEIKKAYPGAVKVKGKTNTYKYKGATLNPARFPVAKKGKTPKEAIKLKDKK